MAYELQQEETPLDTKVVNALIAATPEWWNTATLDVERVTRDGRDSLRFSIKSPEGHRDYVEPPEEIYTTVQELSELFQRHNHFWQQVKYTVTLQEDGDWKYTVEFTY